MKAQATLTCGTGQLSEAAQPGSPLGTCFPTPSLGPAAAVAHGAFLGLQTRE